MAVISFDLFLTFRYPRIKRFAVAQTLTIAPLPRGRSYERRNFLPSTETI